MWLITRIQTTFCFQLGFEHFRNLVNRPFYTTLQKHIEKYDKFGSLNLDPVFKTALPGKLKTCVFY